MRALLLGPTLAGLVLCGPVFAASPALAPWDAISYKEWPEGGASHIGGRSLGTGGNKLFVVDVNSRVDIVFDRSALREQLKKMASDDEQALQRRLTNLTRAAESLAAAYRATEEAWESYNRLISLDVAQRELASRDFREKVARATALQNGILDPLQDAIRERLVSEGQDRGGARVDSERRFDSIIRGGQGLYDWIGLRDLLEKEILLVNEALAARTYVIEMQAHLFSGQGKTALRLPGWFEVEAGPNRPVNKITSLEPETDSKAQALQTSVAQTNEAGEEASDEAPPSGSIPGGDQSDTAKLENLTKAAEKPLPPVIRHAVDDLFPSTNFDLQSMGPQSGDRAEVQVKIFRDARPEEEAEQRQADISWVDTFEIGKFGLQDSIVSSLSFAQQEDVDDWKPAATVSWLLSYRRWPKKDETSRLRINRFRPLSGIGISASAVDFVADEDIEVGFAPTISLLNDFLLVGYGWNLMAEEKREYWFISVRILKGQGILERLESNN